MRVRQCHSPGPPKSPRSILRNPLSASSRTRSGSESGLNIRRFSLTDSEPTTPEARSRYSVADLRTLIRNGYAANPELNNLKSWSGSRIWSSASVLSGSGGTGEADSGEYEEIDSGVGEDPWCQYKSLIQKKKKLILDEHTGWVNTILKQRQCQPIRDLCSSVGDGLTLVNLVEILTNEQVAGITNKPLLTPEKVDNLQNTLRHLELHDVDTQGVNGHDLVDCNLKSTLVLMNNLRRKYENSQSYRPRSSSGERERDVSSGQSPLSPGQSRPSPNTVRFAGDTPPSPPIRATTPILRSSSPGLRRTAYSPGPGKREMAPDLQSTTDIIPGVVSGDRPPSRPPLPQESLRSAIEVNQQLQHEQPIPSQPSSRPQSAKPLGTRAPQYQQAPVVGYPSHPVHKQHQNEHTQHPGVPYGKGQSNTTPPIVTHAWSNDTTLIVPSSVEQRTLQSNQSHSHNMSRGQSPGPSRGMSRDSSKSQNRAMPPSLRSYGVVNGAYECEDGGLIVPPKPRDSRESAMDLNKVPYVPSHPSERPNNEPRQSTLTPNGVHTSQTSHPSQYHIHQPGHQPPTQQSGQLPPNYNPPPQYSRLSTHSQGHVEGELPSPRNTQTGHSGQIGGSHIGSHPTAGNTAYNSPRNDEAVRDTCARSNRSAPNTPIQQRLSSQPREIQDQCNTGKASNQRGADCTYTGNSRHTRATGPLPSRLGNLSSQSQQQPYHIPSSVTVTKVNIHQAVPANGRTSPQGQSSTPASQSPNHEKTSPSPRASQQNYVNVDSLGNVIKDGRSTPNHLSQHMKENVPNQTGVENAIFTNGQLPPSSVYPEGIMGYNMTMDIPHIGVLPDHSPYVGRRLDQSPYVKRHVDGSPHGRGKSPVIMNQGDKMSPHGRHHNHDEDIYSVVKKRVPESSDQATPWSRNKQTIGKSSQQTKQDIEMYKVNGRPPSRSGILPSADQWDSDDSSVTPPLPTLSPSNTPPVTPPRASPGGPLGLTNAGYRVPRGLEVNSKPMTGRRKGRRSGSSARSYDMGWRRSAPGKTAYRAPVRRIPTASTNDLDSVDQGSTTNLSDEEWEDVAPNPEMSKIQQQMEGLESMYTEVLKILGIDKEYLPGSRRSVSSLSSVTRTGSRIPRGQGYSTHRTTREIRTMNKRFGKLEAHVVTLARSVAHLSSEMRTQNGLFQELDDIKKDIRQMKKDRHHHHHLSPEGAIGRSLLPDGRSGVAPDGKPITEFDKFRGWIPSISHPKRVRKLAKFFGEDRMLHFFLEKLGYQKYIKNFRAEEITILELPYMSEERLEKIGIPMGPRQRILQEAQMCFRQENFNIYIV